MTVASSINAEDTIVGYFADSSNVLHGIVRNQQGTITKFSAPGAGTGFFQGTALGSINAVGDIAGSYVDANNVTHGLLRVRTFPRDKEKLCETPLVDHEKEHKGDR